MPQERRNHYGHLLNKSRAREKSAINRFAPKRARHGHKRGEQFRFWLLGLGTVYEGLVMVLSLGYLSVDTRSWLLFDVFED